MPVYRLVRNSRPDRVWSAVYRYRFHLCTKQQTTSENLSKIIEELTEIETKRKDEFSQEDKGVKAETRVSFEL